MCKYCEDKYPIVNKETYESFQNIEISNDILHIDISKSHYDPNKLDLMVTTEYSLLNTILLRKLELNSAQCVVGN